MKILNPIDITDAVLVSTTVPADTRPAFQSGRTYAKAEVCIYEHRAYERYGAGSGTKVPPDDAENWLDLGPTNDRAAFDDVVGTITSGDSPMTFVFRPGGVGGVGFIGAEGRDARVTLTDREGDGEQTVFDQTVSLDATPIFTVYDWFFADYEPLQDFVVTGLPEHYRSGLLTVTITATAGEASVGVCKPCRVLDVGNTKWGAKVGILEFGEKKRDRWGNYSYVLGDYAKTGSLETELPTERFAAVYRSLAKLRGKSIFIVGGDEVPGYEPLTAYAVYKDFSIAVPYRKKVLCSLEYEGMT